MSALLEIADLRVRYGAIEAIKGIGLKIESGKITTLLGANGAGKSTTLLALSGILPAAGSIRFNGVEMQNLAPHRIFEHGVVHVPEGRQILATLSVRENLLLGAYRRSDRAGIAADVDKMLALFPRLKERLGGAAGNLSGGEQQMLAIARGLMARPRLLLLDEPSLGLAPLLVAEIFKTLRRLNNEGLTLLLVEQNSRQALRIADDAYVLENGRIVLSGASGDLLRDPRVIEAYLGG